MKFYGPIRREKKDDGSYNIIVKVDGQDLVVKSVKYDEYHISEEMAKITLLTISSIFYLKAAAEMIEAQDLSQPIWEIAYSTLNADWEGCSDCDEPFYGDLDNMEAVLVILEEEYGVDLHDKLLSFDEEELFKFIDPKIDALVRGDD